MKNEIYGSLVTIKNHAECNNPPYRKIYKINFAICFAANLTWSLLTFLFQPQVSFHTRLIVIKPKQAINVFYKYAHVIGRTRANMITNWQ